MYSQCHRNIRDANGQRNHFERNMTGRDTRSHYTYRWNGGCAVRKAQECPILIMVNFAVHSVVLLNRMTPTLKATIIQRVRSANWTSGPSTERITCAST